MRLLPGFFWLYCASLFMLVFLYFFFCFHVGIHVRLYARSTKDRHLLVHHNAILLNLGMLVAGGVSHGVSILKCYHQRFPPCQHVVIWFLLKKCSFVRQISQWTQVPRFLLIVLLWRPWRRWVGESVMERDGAPPWPGKDWGCRRTAGQVFWAAHRGVSPGSSAWPTSISVPGEINGKMWPKQSNITAMAGTCSNNGERGGFPISLLKMRHTLQLIPSLNECLLLAPYLFVAIEID